MKGSEILITSNESSTGSSTTNACTGFVGIRNVLITRAVGNETPVHTIDALVMEFVSQGGLEGIGERVCVVQLEEPVLDLRLGNHVTSVHNDAFDGGSGDLGGGFEGAELGSNHSEQGGDTLSGRR